MKPWPLASSNDLTVPKYFMGKCPGFRNIPDWTFHVLTSNMKLSQTEITTWISILRISGNIT